MQQQATNIQDFGQKIGGAKKDLARQQMDRIKLITTDALLTQPLSKLLPRPDFTKLYRAGQITSENAIKLQFLYDQLPTKPRDSYKVKRWAESIMVHVNKISQVLSNQTADIEPVFASANYQKLELEMKTANWPETDYNPYPYKIEKTFYYNTGKGEYYIKKGGWAVKYGSMEECVNWIKEQSGSKKEAQPLQCSVYFYRSTKEYFITPKGKSKIILRRNFSDAQEALEYIQNHNDELKKTYDNIRFVPSERRNWNRPRVGENHRSGMDITPEHFSSVFPFRGVEFGNWLNQVDRAASLNEAYDALMDLALALGVEPEIIALDNQLAMAFGARGSGKASAHYEQVKKVINLTKTRGAGSLAHEWFHALDNYICIKDDNPLSFASDVSFRMQGSTIYDAFSALRAAIIVTGFYKRSCECDKFKTKLYWGSTVELCARGFEKYIILKLDSLGWHNDYLANIKSFGEYGANDKYPYPSDEEIKLLSPYYDNLIKCVFSNILKQTA